MACVATAFEECEGLGYLVDAGKSVIVIEHHLAVMAAAWIIDLGPSAAKMCTQIIGTTAGGHRQREALSPWGDRP